MFGKSEVDESHSSVLTGRKDYDENPLIAAATVEGESGVETQ